jgi:hypothetical protein
VPSLTKLPERHSECTNASAGGLERFGSRVVPIGPVHAPGACPLRDATFCDEWDSLDADCDGALSRQELAWTQTLHGYDDEPWEHSPRYILPNGTGIVTGFQPQPWREAVTARPLDKQRVVGWWGTLFEAADVDRSAGIDFGEWVQLQDQMRQTFGSCGDVLNHSLFRYRAGASGEGADGAYPIRPCAACPLRWVHCDLSHYGGGWTLVYQTAGRDPSVGVRGQKAPEELFMKSFSHPGHRNLSSGEMAHTARCNHCMQDVSPKIYTTACSNLATYRPRPAPNTD